MILLGMESVDEFGLAESSTMNKIEEQNGCLHVRMGTYRWLVRLT
jgi:hypothetical protein